MNQIERMERKIEQAKGVERRIGQMFKNTNDMKEKIRLAKVKSKAERRTLARIMALSDANG